MTQPNGVLAAGRELDALVAERVMGYEWADEQSPSGRFLHTPEGWPAAYVPLDSKEPTFTSHLPAFSTDIAAAWLVVEKMRARAVSKYGREYCFELADVGMAFNNGYPISNAWQAAFQERGFDRVSAHGETPALAICRAALAAVEATHAA